MALVSPTRSIGDGRMRQAAVTLALLCLPLTVAAQRITITPSAGAYFPLGTKQRNVAINDCFAPPCPQGPEFLTKLQRSAAFGLEIASQWDGGVGVQLSIATSGARQRHETRGLAPEDTEVQSASSAPARTTSAAIRIAFARSMGRRTDLALGLGFSFTQLTGAEYSRLADRSLVGPSLAVTLGTVVSSRMRFQVAVVNTFYSRDPPPSLNWEWTTLPRHDVILSAGLGLMLKP